MYLHSRCSRDPVEFDAGKSHRVVVLVKGSTRADKDGRENILNLTEENNKNI